MKKILIFLMTSLMFITIPNIVYGYDDGYQIDEYNIKMKVNEDNSFNIEEKLNVTFNEKRQGIFRTIPVTNEVIREDGTKEKNRARIIDITSNATIDITDENSNKVIRLGDEGVYLTGSHSYNINYTYKLRQDKIKGYDELYFNLIGTNWDTNINKVKFQIEMPKDFDKEKIGFSLGSYGSTGYEDIVYTVNDNIITGTYYGKLAPYEGLNIRIELEDGYFVVPPIKLGILEYLVIIVSIIAVIYAYKKWKEYGKDDIVVETVEFYPPEDYNSLEIAFMNKGVADTKDIVSLLVYLASKGYIKIEETEEGFIGKRTYFTKLKEYDGAKVEEKMFMEKLFSINGDKVEITQLKDKFYTTINKISDSINKYSNSEKIYDKKPKGVTFKLILAIIFIMCAITISPVYEYTFEAGSVIFCLLATIVPLTVIVLMFTSRKIDIMAKAIFILFSLVFIMIAGFTIIIPSLMYTPIYIPIYILGIIASILINVFINILEKRNKYGAEILGRIRGFKRYLETAEKEELEARVNKDPKYFYDILPYAYVLGVSNTWIKKFESIAIEPPDWYVSPNGFSPYVLGACMTRTIASTSSYSASPSTSGSGSSGGGFSGGGFGGGGGGSW